MEEQKLKNKPIKTEIQSIAISCNTFKRPDFLGMCLDGIKKLNIPENINIEVIVVDNDTNATGRPVVETVMKDFPFKINYFIEEKRGLANARNRLLQEAVRLGFSHIAMLDDDDIPEHNWLVEHINLYNSDDRAYITAGPQYTEFCGDFPNYIKNNNIFVKRTTKKKGEVRKICATNNVFLPVDIMTKADVWFDPSFIFMGGEDGDFFTRAGNKGYTIIFNSDAIVREINDKERANIKWILNRSYYNGYSGSFLKFKDSNNFLSRTAYIVKTLTVCLLDLILIPLSFVRGRTGLLNVLGLLYKNCGKLQGAMNLKPLNYYKNLNGAKDA